MRVCTVVSNSVWYDPRVRKQLDAYIKNGVDVVCVGKKCWRYDTEKIALIPCPVTIIEDAPCYIGRQRSPIKKLKREKARNQSFCDAIVAYKPDVIHANDWDTLEACVKAARKLGCRLVYDSHEIFVENHHMKGGYKAYVAWSERRCIKWVDQMVCVSHAAAEYFANKYCMPKPMVITNCSLLKECVIAENKNEGFEVLNHGQYYAGRGYDILIEASMYLKDWPHIKVALRGFGQMEDQLRVRAGELGGKNVRFYSPVLVQELIPEASKSHVGIAITENTCINFRLSVSNKLFEYASAGLPVIMSDIPEHRYLNEKYHFGIVLPENTPLELAKAMIKLYSDHGFYESCVQGAKRLTQNVNWDNEFARLIDLERSWVDGSK